ncbi:MAG: hypothetical protein CTY20_12845 [Hyphomicrobium sp.]|nr:MAG: hypothetical protein CTY20_12845 [Hyphomicrobium sp.]
MTGSDVAGENIGSGPRLGKAVPLLYVRDLIKALDYYQTVFGFRVGWTVGDPLELASICRDQIEFNLTQARPEQFCRSRVYVYVDNVDAYYDQIVAAGARITHPLADRHYGMKDCRIEDPDGNQISFGTPVVT